MALPVTPLRLGQDAQQQLVSMGLSVLSDAALFWLVTLGAGAVWTVAVMHPEPWRILAAMGYSGCVLAPFIYLRRQRDRG